MHADTVTALARLTLETTLWVSAPILIVAIVVGLVVSILQVMTSIQEMTIATVPRLAAVGVAVFIMTPWMLRKLIYFASMLLSDFHPYVG